jgi:hypothetical protein
MNTTQRTMFRFVAFALLLTTATTASAQFTMNWYTVDGGGHTFSTGGTFSLGATIGQHDAGTTMSGGSFTLVGGGGFWGGVIPCPADLDGDGVIGQGDLGALLAAYGTCPGNPGYNPAAGALGGDPCVTQADLGALLSVYGTICP